MNKAVLTMAAHLPMCVIGTFDPLTHKTLEDLRFIVRHEMDLYEEGEPNEIRNDNDLKACRRFLKSIA